jgi:hypothetical protein
MGDRDDRYAAALRPSRQVAQELSECRVTVLSLRSKVGRGMTRNDAVAPRRSSSASQRRDRIAVARATSCTLTTKRATVAVEDKTAGKRQTGGAR